MLTHAAHNWAFGIKRWNNCVGLLLIDMDGILFDWYQFEITESITQISNEAFTDTSWKKSRKTRLKRKGREQSEQWVYTLKSIHLNSELSTATAKRNNKTNHHHSTASNFIPAKFNCVILLLLNNNSFNLTILSDIIWATLSPSLSLAAGFSRYLS